MKRIAAWMMFCLASAAVAGARPTEPVLTAADIVDKNVAARGGIDAWRKIETMVWVGHIESGNASAQRVPFMLGLKQPNKTRFEITMLNQKTVRAYDGGNGWKLRPARDGKPDIQPFTVEELKFARDGQGIEGPLIDYRTKGVAVALEGVDSVEGHAAYRLSVKLPSGASRHVWIDAQTFLDIKSDREAHNAFGQAETVSTYYRDYKTIDGLQIPMTMETGSDVAAKGRDKMVIDKVDLNPPLDDRMFAKPHVLGHRKVVAIEADPAQPFGRTVRPSPSGTRSMLDPGPTPVSGAGNVRP